MVQDIALRVDGIPDRIPDTKAATYRSRLIRHTRELMIENALDEIDVNITTDSKPSLAKQKSKNGILRNRRQDDELTIEERAEQYKSQKPFFDFDFLILPDSVMQDLKRTIRLIEVEHKVFDDWGLRRIEPFPRTALNFYGPPGTGKTLAGHAIANYIGSPIMPASYAQIESKFHGDGPKNVEALFFAAERDKAVLFIDEADSLLSKRLTTVTQGSEQAINSMRSQLLISLEKFHGVVIFATNLVQNYDKAFETRVRNIHFPMPDEKSRYEIWRRHLGDGSKPPLSKDVDLHALAKIEDICGRDIKNSLIDAALDAAEEKNFIAHADLVSAIERVKASKTDRGKLTETNASPADENLSQKILSAVKDQETSN